jgi:hypothetical protein
VRDIELVPKDVIAPLSRLVARELIEELTGVYSGYRLQVGITPHVIQHVNNKVCFIVKFPLNCICIDELTGVYSGYRLQVGVTPHVINT